MGPSRLAKWAFIVYPALIAGVLVLEWAAHEGRMFAEKASPIAEARPFTNLFQPR